MGRIKLAGYIIESWMGDHYPKHVHVYKDGREVAKLQIPEMILLTGRLSKKLRKTIEKIVKEKKI